MSQAHRNILANNVEKLRTARNMNKEELSLALGFDNSYISKLENSNINVTIDRLNKIAEFFGIKLNELLAEDLFQCT